MCAALVVYEGLDNQLVAAQVNPYGPAPSAPQQLPAYGFVGPRPLNASCATSNYNLCPSGSVVGIQAYGASNISVQVASPSGYNATLQIESALDCTNFNALPLTPQSGGGAVSTITSTAGIWSGTLQAQGCVQVRVSSYTSGIASVTIGISSSGGGVASGGGGGGGPATQSTGSPANPWYFIQSSFVPNTAPSLFFNNSTVASTVQVVPLSAGKATYLLSFTLNSAVTQVVTLEYGTGSNCGTGTINIGPFPVVAGSGIELGYTFIPSGQALCYVTPTAGQVAAIATGYQQ